MPNDSSTIGIITSYPAKNGEIASANAISRYSYLLSRSISKDQKLVIFCEGDNKSDISYQSETNILIVPTYKLDSLGFFAQVLDRITKFYRIKDYLIQFEFSIFGGKKVIPSFLLTLLSLKLLGKNVTITLHQVATNLNELSGHLGLTKNSFKTHFLNLGLNIFYRLVGLLSNRIVVHDELLKSRLSKFVKLEIIDVIPHPVGDENVKRITSKLTDIARKQFEFSKKDLVVGVYGYRSWYKGTDWIVKTIKEISSSNPKLNLKLLVAGGVSPTLKNTSSYKNFDRKLKNMIKKSDSNIKVTGFLPEKDVWKVFAASDLIVFPYRTRMSASGAYSLTVAYKKPFLVSNHFAAGSDIDFSSNIFDMNSFSFEKALNKVLKSKKIQKEIISTSTKLNSERSWLNVSRLYLDAVKSVNINSYANVYSTKKVYQLAQN